MTSVTRTTCPYCGVGCGVLARTLGDGRVEVAGDPAHPANHGRLCSKGAALAETLALEGRLLHPMIDGRPVGWEAALDHVAETFSRTIAEHGPDSVAFYVSGQILTEDYYVANKLMKGFIGSANIDTNSRLCMASSVAGHRRAFGTDTVPGTYEDIDEADLVVLVGSNLAWCHPVLFQRLEAARLARGTKVVVIDPRETATCAIADVHLAIAPDSDVALFNGLLLAIVGANAVDGTYVAAHTSGLRAAVSAAAAMSTRETARAVGLSEATLHDFYDLFARTERVVTIYSQGVNQSTTGSDKVNAIINCHLATGRIGRPGMGPFSVTGQPNAMGGREVGGLANMLAAHMNIEDAGHRNLVQRFWGSPRIAAKPGLKAVDMFRAVGDGRIKAIWIMATNPVDSMPEADRVRSALAACPFVVVSDVERHTDTTACAHVLLPAVAWGEKSGTVTNSERRISRQRAFLPAPGEARADWWQLAEVGKRMGFAADFNYAGPHEILAEHARLTGLENDGRRDLDIGALGAIDAAAFDALEPFQWPRPAGRPGAARFFADGGFFTPDGRARFVPTRFEARPSRTPADRSAAYPFTLNTGRIRDQWHTMTRTARTARLLGHIGEPFVEIHPDDAQQIGVEPAGLAEVASPHGRAVVRVLVTGRQQRGSVFVPMHWTDQLAGGGRIDALVAGDFDPVSGQPGLKQTAVAVRPFRASWFALAVTRERPSCRDWPYWATARVPGGFRTEIAGREAGAGDGAGEGVGSKLTGGGTDAAGDRSGDGVDAVALLQRLCGSTAAGNAEVLSYRDRSSGQQRVAWFEKDRLVAALFVATSPVAVSRTWAAALLGEAHADRLRVLAGRSGAAARDRGAIVCSCFDVGANDIAEAVVRGGCTTVAAVGAALKAGTNCGSCRAEIGRLVQRHARESGAERAATGPGSEPRVAGNDRDRRTG